MKWCPSINLLQCLIIGHDHLRENSYNINNILDFSNKGFACDSIFSL